jgi:hypothetical protein
MNYFRQFKSVSEKCLSLIKYSVKEFNFNEQKYVLYTYTIKKKFRDSEDDIYAKNQELVQVLPRACSIVVSDSFTTIMEGPRKFSGITPIDEDPDDNENTESTKSTLFNKNEITTWKNEGVLEVIETEKANGKFAILRIVNNILFFGSKNSHFVVPLNNLDYFYTIENVTSIVRSIFEDIKFNLESILKLQYYFYTGYSLVGELCDGQHFTDGDNTISFFGLFRDGDTYSCLEGLELISSTGLKTVPFNKIENPNLDTLHLISRCKNNEGSVLYFRNTSTNKIVLAKVKSALYIVKRFLREIITRRGYKSLETLQNRFINAKDYHGLNTKKSIELTRLLYSFGFWLMDNKYPCNVLSCNETGGFNKYWKQFTSTEPIITVDDFGEFNESEYLEQTQLYQKRDYNNLATVVFLQGLQGSGKSRIAKLLTNKLNNAEFVEQDQFSGDTLACQGKLYHLCNANGPKYIIVSRCNVEEKQYNSYLKICYSLPTKVIFIAPDTLSKVYLAVSLSGILQRENNYTFDDAYTFTTANYHKFKVHSEANLIKVLQNETLVEITKDFIIENQETLRSLRMPLDKIVNDCLEIILNPSKLVLNEYPIYVGLAVSEKDRTLLTDFVNQYVNSGIIYCHHITQVYLGSKKSIKNYTNLILPEERVTANINSLVIRKEDNASAFKVNLDIFCENKTPHITAKMPINVPPAQSNAFVGLTDNTVTIIECDFTLELTGFYY